MVPEGVEEANDAIPLMRRLSIVVVLGQTSLVGSGRCRLLLIGSSLKQQLSPGLCPRTNGRANVLCDESQKVRQQKVAETDGHSGQRYQQSYGMHLCLSVMSRALSVKFQLFVSSCVNA